MNRCAHLPSREVPRSRRAAFTMIELLIVVAILSVLAGIAVPNFLEAQLRTKIARVHADMAATAVGLDRYYADHGAYPSNDPEVFRYLKSAMANPIMDSTHTSAPADAKIPWWEGSRDGETPMLTSETMGMTIDFGYSIGSDRIEYDLLPPIAVNAGRLSVLSSPVSYLGTSVSRDVFGMRKEQFYGYVNSSELFADDGKSTSTKGLWGDHLTSQTYFYLVSAGPNGQSSVWHPISGPWIDYDPTNGITSAGDLLYFEGKKPGGREGDKALRPDSVATRRWGW